MIADLPDTAEIATEGYGVRVEVYRGFPIFFKVIIDGHRVYDVYDPRGCRVARLLSIGAAQVWVDDLLYSKS
jgi:hypothetical protein